MTDLSNARAQTLQRLAESRAQIRRVLEPPPRHEFIGAADGENDDTATDDAFPRSRTMKLLTSGRGVGTVGAMVGGLLMARPALAWRLLRMLPTGAVARMVVVRAIAALGSRQR